MFRRSHTTSKEAVRKKAHQITTADTSCLRINCMRVKLPATVLAVLFLFWVLGFLLLGEPAFAQNATSKSIVVKAGRLLDPRVGRVVNNAIIVVEGDRIRAV